MEDISPSWTLESKSFIPPAYQVITYLADITRQVKMGRKAHGLHIMNKKKPCK